MAARTRSHEDRNITELKESYRGLSPGWCVRFRVYSFPPIQKDFSNHRYGGRLEARNVARRFRDAIEREIEFIIACPGGAFDRLTSRNKTGVVGVSRIDRKYIDKRWGTPCHDFCWEARWPDKDREGRHRTKKFSIKEHGEPQARQLAIDARTNGLREFAQHNSQTFRPPKPTTKFWRYMDFTKLVSMLEKGMLFFAFASRMSDAFEGGYSRGNEELREYVYKALGPFTITSEETLRRRESTALSCWHANSHESAAMWKLYSSMNESICIQTTFGQLQHALPQGVSIWQVKYIDHETEWVPERHPLLPFFYKRKSFEHEHEYRVVYDASGHTRANESDFEVTDSGVWVNCKPEEMI